MGARSGLWISVISLLCVATLSQAKITFDERGCPLPEHIVYSPFKNWSYFWPTRNRQQCWGTAICLLDVADEARKQQFSATSLVMGLIPLTLKDIAWPERRLIAVSRQQPIAIEILVRTLGLVPVEVAIDAKTLASQSSTVVRWAWGLRRRYLVLVVGLTSLALFAAYGALGLVEVYSKGASLGCPYPIFVLSWYIIALLPATLHTWMSRIRGKWNRHKAKRIAHNESTEHVLASEEGHASSSRPHRPDTKGSRLRPLSTITTASAAEEKRRASAVQGADEWWVVQLSWAIYYIAGTLIFSSIMAVTVPELAAWVVVAFAVTGCSKLLAVFLCLAFEREIQW